MRTPVVRASRRGIAPQYMLMIAAAGLLGFVMLKHMKAKAAGAPAAPSSTQSVSVPSIGAPAAPESTASSRTVAAADPELMRLSDSSQRAQDGLSAALASGNPQQIADARDALQSAQQALLAKKQSMY